jgi:N-acetylglucosamine-6-phosphate deacetylase
VSGTALVNGRVLLDRDFESGKAVILDRGRVAAVLPVADVPASMARRDLGGNLLLPGFIDIQVNGGGGLLFNDDPSVETVAAIGAAHRRFGTTGFLPTLISDDLEKVRLAMEAVRAAMTTGIPGVLGIHLEGPFINLERKGAHDAASIRDIDDAAIDLLTMPGPGRTVVTLAPEKVAMEVIRRLTAGGVIVCAGHTNATAETVFAALDNGLRGFTHLFNAMSPLAAREPGVVGAALYDDRGWCGVVVDGRHVHPVVLQIALRASPKSRFMLVTDAMPTVGATQTSFVLQGRKISVENGVCVDEHGTLAGSDLDMASAVRNGVGLLGLTPAESATMASRNPAEFLGLGDQLGRIAPGYRADLVLADDALNVLETWIAGRPSGG